MNQELTAQVKQLLEQQDQQSLKFIISDESKQTIDNICQQLREDQAILVKKIYEELQKQGNCGLTLVSLSKSQKNKKIDELLQGEGREQNKMQSFLQLLSRTNQKLRYMQEYGFPFYDLFKRIMITHGDIHPLMQTVKSLHSQVQFLLSVMFKQQVLVCLQHRYNNLDLGFRTLLSTIFEKQCEKYFNFQNLYKNLKKSTEEEQSCDDDDSEQEEPREIPLTQDQTLMIDQKQFLVSLADSVSIQDFQQFNKNRSLNFLCFGIKKLQPFIGIPSSIFKYLKQKEFCQLLSFLLIRFIRKIIFTINRQRNDGKLSYLTKAITSQQITIVGNQLSDQISAKIDSFIAPIKTPQQKAKQIFLFQFDIMNYEDFVPKRYILQAKSKQIDPAVYIWQQIKQYKIFWLQRVKAEKYIEQGQKGIQPSIQYIDYIKNNFADFNTSKPNLWKTFISIKLGYSPQVKSQPGKRRKLQSLND